MNVSVTISPAENALDSLRRTTKELTEPGADKGTALKGALDWGWHATGLLAYMRLQPARESFDAWVQEYLHEGEPGLHVERDSLWEEKQQLSYLQLLDLLSDVDLPSLKPDFYQGWQDRNSRCRGLREKVNKVLGCSLTDQQRSSLLLLLAAYHRLMHMNAEISLDTGQVLREFPVLLDLMEMLICADLPNADALREELDRCRSAL